MQEGVIMNDSFIAPLPKQIINQQTLQLRDLAKCPCAGKEGGVDVSSKWQTLLNFHLAVKICSQYFKITFTEITRQ